MKKVFVALSFLVATASYAVLPEPGTPGAPTSKRYCGEPARYSDGTIKRSQKALREFVKDEPCPYNLLEDTSCPEWQIDHIWPLANGGCDAPHNMSWMPNVLKTCAGICKDRWERKYNAIPRQKIVLPPVKLVPIK